MNKQLDILVDNIEVNVEDIDTKNNEKIKDLYRANKSRAIELIVKDNSNYYHEIVSNYKNLSDEYLLGAILDSIYQSLEKYELTREDKTYISMSGIILKHKIINKIKHDNTKKNGGEESEHSFDDIKSKGHYFDNKSLLHWENNFNGYMKLELEDLIEKNVDLSPTQKKVAKIYIKNEGRVLQKDLAEELGITQQAVSYHMTMIRKHIDFL